MHFQREEDWEMFQPEVCCMLIEWFTKSTFYFKSPQKLHKMSALCQTNAHSYQLETAMCTYRKWISYKLAYKNALFSQTVPDTLNSNVKYFS